MAISTLRSLIPGQTWLTGTVAPEPNVGYLTQFYLNTLTGEVYQKTAIDIWTLRGDLTPTEISELTILPSGTGSGDTGEIKFKELLANGGNQIALKAPDSIPTTYDFVLPDSPGSAGFALTTDGTGKMSWSSGSSLAPVTSVNTKTGDVVLSTTDIGEGTNKYFTDGRAQTAAVVNSTSGAETTKAPSVGAIKQFTTNAIAVESSERQSADAILQTNINNEISARQAADNTLQTNFNNEIAAETTNRIAADNNLQTNIDAEATARQAADTLLQTNINNEATARQAADALLIPLAQKGAAEGVATLDAAGLIPAGQIPFTAAPVQSVNTKIGNVILGTDDVSEGATNKYFTDARAKTAAVIGSMAGSEPDQAPSVSSAKAFIELSVNTEKTAREAADAVLQTNIDNEANTRSVADTNLHDEITGEIAARQAADALLIPLTQKGAPDGVATLDASGLIPTAQIPFTAAPVQSVNTKTGDVVLVTDDVSEGATNKYFTDGRAKQAVVLDVTTGLETDQAPSVHAMKEYVTVSVATETAAREAADALLIPLTQKGVADGVATLDATGKIPPEQIPPTAITSVTVVSTIAERDALTPQEGDFCVVTSVNETFVYNGTAWIELQVGSAVISVAGKTGAVSLSTQDVSEDPLFLYYTDERAKLAAVVNSNAGSETDKAMSVASAKMFTTDAVQVETAAREAADALLIPLTQKGVADGVATLDAAGLIPTSQIPPGAVPVQSVNSKTGAVELKTVDIAEDTNLYFTDERAKIAAVINDMTGTQIDQAPSVSAIKTFTTTEIAAEAALRNSADTILQNNINAEQVAREAADALLIPLTQKGAPFGVAVLDADGKIDVGNIPGAASNLGTPTRGTYDGGLLGFTPSTTIADAADETNLILAKLAPSKPPNLSTKTISLTSSYSAKESGTNTLRNIVTDVLKPQISTVSTFYNGDSGTLSAEIDASVAGSIVLTPASEAGTYGALVVTSDVDYYAGQAGKEGFWRALSGYIVSATNLPYGVHSYQMKHSETGNTNLLSFYVDNPATPTISGDTLDLSSVTTSYVSGVPTLSSGSQIKFSFSVNSAVGKFFNSSKVADITGSNTSTANIAPDAAGYAENAVITVSNATVSVNSLTYSEAPSVSIRGYNSKSVSGTVKSVSLGSRIDTVSNESSRKVSGSGQYPATGYGGAFDSSKSLKTDYSEELQMLNGLFQRPASVNYSSNVPVAGPDYSSGMGTSDRWVTFVYGGSLSSASAFTLTINGTSGTWSGTQTSGVKIYAKVEGVTGWIDCNASYPGVGSPSNNGDPAMVFGSSSATSKRVTFGSTTRSGTLYIRIAFPSGSDKKFSSITIGSIV